MRENRLLIQLSNLYHALHVLLWHLRQGHGDVSQSLLILFLTCSSFPVRKSQFSAATAMFPNSISVFMQIMQIMQGRVGSFALRPSADLHAEPLAVALVGSRQRKILLHFAYMGFAYVCVLVLLVLTLRSVLSGCAYRPAASCFLGGEIFLWAWLVMRWVLV
jgi:hypothetical protein